MPSSNAAVPSSPAQPAGPGRLARWLRETRGLLLILLLMGIARTSFANHYMVPSGSMQPTLEPGDRVAVDMSAYGLRVPFTDLQLVERGTPQRGDVVVFKSPADGTRLIKRVVAVAGDTVQLAGGHLRINGRAMASPVQPDVERFGNRSATLGLWHGGGPDIDGLVVPQGKLLVLGDHRGNSLDGRFFGLVDARSVYARALGVYWRSGEGPLWQSL